VINRVRAIFSYSNYYDTVTVCEIFYRTPMFDIWFGAGAVGARAASRWGSGSTKMIRLLVNLKISVMEPLHFYAAPGENFDAAPAPARNLSLNTC
jgi:hypothetical protein